MRSFLRVLFWLVLVEEAIALSLPSILEEVQHHATTHESSTSSSNLRVRTLSSTTVTTPDCSVIRRAPYPAELQLFYEYSIEFKAGRAVSLTDMERHIANAVAIQLNICDTSGRPVFKVRTDAPHRFSDKSKFCSKLFQCTVKYDRMGDSQPLIVLQSVYPKYKIPMAA